LPQCRNAIIASADNTRGKDIVQCGSKADALIHTF